MNEQVKKQFDKLFSEADLVFTGDKYTRMPINQSEFFVINPLNNLDNRTNENVSEAKNFLMEFDTGTYEEQLSTIKTLEASNLPVTTATFSGSKSIHLILSMAEKLNYDYRQAWTALAAEITELTGLSPDKSCKNEARLSRLAGAIRPETGKEQSLLHTGGYLKNSKIAELVNKYGIKAPGTGSVVVSMNPDLDLVKFKWTLREQVNSGLYSTLRSAPAWAASEGMYYLLFRYTNWVIDATGAPKETFLEYAREKIFPHLLNAGYPEYKLDKPIHNAYDWKT